MTALPSGLDPRRVDRFRAIVTELEAQAAKWQAAGDSISPYPFIRGPDGKPHVVSLNTPEGREAYALDRLREEIAQVGAVDRDLDDLTPARGNSNESPSHARTREDSSLGNPPTPEGVGGLPHPLTPSPERLGSTATADTDELRRRRERVRGMTDELLGEMAYMSRRLREIGINIDPAAVLETARILLLSASKAPPGRHRRRERLGGGA